MNTQSGLNFHRKVYFAKILFMACRKLIRTCDLFDDDLFDLRYLFTNGEKNAFYASFV